MNKDERIKYHIEQIRINANHGSKVTKEELISRLSAVYVSVCRLDVLLTQRETERATIYIEENVLSGHWND